MAQTGAQRLDPYKNFKFRLRDGNNVYFGSKLTGLISSSDVAEYRQGGDPSGAHKLPGRSKYEDITLTRGVTSDQSFSNWASQVMSYGSSLGSEVSLANFRKDIYLEFQNEAGQPVVSYQFGPAGITEFPAQGCGRVVVHPPHKHESIQEQLAAIFESSLRRLRP